MDYDYAIDLMNGYDRKLDEIGQLFSDNKKKLLIIKAKLDDFRKTYSSKLQLVDLFAGTGGFSYAFESTGLYETIYSNDIDPYCKQTYDLNFNRSMFSSDIHYS